MNSITSSAIALVIGIAIGIGGTYALTSSASGKFQLEIPTEEEARASLQAAKPNDWPNLQLSLGQCDKDTLGPGVRCAVDVTYDGLGGGQRKRQSIVGFSQTPSGWMASLYQ
ncbi:hypothetical protein [Mesorhizobium sp.]|uniref:hypothetical protein n=1 Tax=Mesorhizobium sp. TaxID=1871066 RepID=UPI000FEA208D|nr:hypothetical protein [Mesorhizobium sp.]RWM45530.1 MAG: hypothetical protein EOR76_21100 [Mesorhizobium sp.]RWM58148.1 MAG: hypothetical protein EOR79_14085 [Mesorhizobium sp.]RWM58685.1 MAG: hypothetical protein EOR78_06190 [Mesorhizobium sp.]TIO70014.1 MAG: hypothetical protein E5X85_07630 [Mesorhizobium sp.]TJV83244.1 MAG: hypothetical protein E5X84_34100 [Mesorhizobium sp.]